MRAIPLSAITLGFCLGLVVAIAPACGSNSGGTGGGAAGGGSAGGGNGGAGGGSGGAAAFCADFANSYCEFAVRCNLVAMASKAECVAYIGPQFCRNQPSAEKGYIAFNSANAQACTTAIKNSLSCDPRDALAGPCADIFLPGAASRSACFASDDCINENEACGGASCMKTCQPAGSQGKPCTRFGTCDTGLRCELTTGICVGPAAVGGDCTSGANQCDATSYCDLALTRKCVALPTAGQTCRGGLPRCTNGFYCSNTTCQARLAQGVTCPAAADSCQTALFCDTTKVPTSCQPRAQVGGTCTGDGCAAGLRCIRGSCATPRMAGGTCATSSDCAPGLSCDDVLRSCQAFNFEVAAGETCTDDVRSCDTDLSCRGFAVNPDGGVGTVGRCVVPKVGDACTSNTSGECPRAAFCNVPVGTATGSCVAATNRSPCSYGDNCRVGDYCEGALCTAQKAAGAACASSGACVSPLKCIAMTPGSSVCGNAGDIGANCAASSACRFPLTCVSGLCAHAGATGEKCYDSSVCLTGTCSRDAGTCDAPTPNGGLCKQNTECASGQCNTGLCEAVCP